MSDYDPAAQRSLARRLADSVTAPASAALLSLAHPRVAQAAINWAHGEQRYLITARAVGVSEDDALAVLDDVMATRRARGLLVACDDAFRDARNLLHAGNSLRAASDSRAAMERLATQPAAPDVHELRAALQRLAGGGDER